LGAIRTRVARWEDPMEIKIGKIADSLAAHYFFGKSVFPSLSNSPTGNPSDL
jgi:hypothetical protein